MTVTLTNMTKSIISIFPVLPKSGLSHVICKKQRNLHQLATLKIEYITLLFESIQRESVP